MAAAVSLPPSFYGDFYAGFASAAVLSCVLQEGGRRLSNNTLTKEQEKVMYVGIAAIAGLILCFDSSRLTLPYMAGVGAGLGFMYWQGRNIGYRMPASVVAGAVTGGVKEGFGNVLGALRELRAVTGAAAEGMQAVRSVLTDSSGDNLPPDDAAKKKA